MTDDSTQDLPPSRPHEDDVDDGASVVDADQSGEQADDLSSATHERQDPDHVGVDWELTPRTRD